MAILIFLFLIIFPFGQILRIGILQPLDVVVGIAAAYAIIKKLEVPEFFKHLRPFLLIAGASWILSIFLFHQITVLYGLLYLLRLAAYFYFGVFVWNFVKKKAGNKKLLLDSLLTLSVVSALFGWIQFFVIPDIRPFFVWGWDLHFLRIVGTFLDPTFLGLIIVFGLILSIYRCIDSLNFRNILLTLFLLISLAFTYSRASYLAFIAAILAIIFFEKRFKKLLLLGISLILIAFVLPTSRNHSIDLFRTFSTFAKIENYQSTLKIFSTSPVFGVGYNNMCLAYRKYIGFQDFSSHACSGSDSSLLFVLTTTGIVGLMIFIFSVHKTVQSLPKNRTFYILGASFLALIVHSLFSNSMFYPWIMGWIVILLAEV
jgi:hypothetical protein